MTTPQVIDANGKVDQNAVLEIIRQQGKGASAASVDNALWQREDVQIERQGKRIILPAEPREMSIPAAIDALQRRLATDQQEVVITEFFEGHYAFDAAVAFVRAMRETFGWASPVPTPQWWGKELPSMLGVRTGPNPNDVMQVPMGSFNVPGIDNRIETGINAVGVFYAQGKIKNIQRAVLMELVTVAKQILERDSIYKGKALRLNVNSVGGIDHGVQPDFLHTNHVQVNELMLNDDITALLDTTLFTPIKYTEAVRKHSIPLKRGVLLAGQYGTGKSLAASVTSRICVDNGWTFIILSDISGLKEGLLFAKRYQPAVLFAEDLDRIIEERDDAGNELLNTIDGVLSKDSKVITVLTSNFPEKIDKAMLRPGRLDAIIQVLPPDAKTAEKLIRQWAGSLLDPKTTLLKAGAELTGQIPATIREVVERAKLAMISRGDTKLTEGDLLVSVTGMKHHLALLNGDLSEKPTPEYEFGAAAKKLLINGSDEKIEAVGEQAAVIDVKVDKIRRAVGA